MNGSKVFRVDLSPARTIVLTIKLRSRRKGNAMLVGSGRGVVSEISFLDMRRTYSQLFRRAGYVTLTVPEPEIETYATGSETASQAGEEIAEAGEKSGA